MGAYQRTKGHNWEREVARLFKRIMPFEAVSIKRNIQSRADKESGADIDVPYFHVECKVGNKPNIRRAILQAIETNQYNKTPLAIIKDDRGLELAILPLDSFMSIIEHWWYLKNGGQ